MDYTYTKQDILRDTGLKPGTFYNRIKELGIKDNIDYMKKVKENNRDKTYFNQKAYDMLLNYQESVKDTSNLSNDNINDMSSNDSSISMYLHKEIVSLLKQQLEEKDKQIERLQNIIGVKEQTTLVEKQKQLGTSEDNRKWWQFFKRMSNKKVQEEM